MDAKRIPLLFEKFQNSIHKHRYDISQLFITPLAGGGMEVRFVKVKSPRYNKVFFVAIPTKFCIKLTVADLQEKVYIKTKIYFDHSNEEPIIDAKTDEALIELHQLSYFDLFKNASEYNILCISSKNLVYFDKNKSIYTYYAFTEPVKVKEKLDPKKEKENKIKQLEENLKKAKIKVIKDSDMEFVERTPPPTSESVEIIFEDEDGQVIEKDGDVQKLIDFPETKINITKNKVVTLKKSIPPMILPTQKKSATVDEKSLKNIPVPIKLSSGSVQPKNSAPAPPGSDVMPGAIPSSLDGEVSEKEDKDDASETSEETDVSSEEASDVSSETSDNASETSSVETDISEEIDETEMESADREKEKCKLRINDLPDTIFKNNIEVGTVYIVFDLTTVFHWLNVSTKEKSFEDILIEKYALLDYNEFNAREEKMRGINKVLEECKIESFDKLYKIQEREEEIKKSLNRLSTVLISCESVQQKTIEKAKKRGLLIPASPTKDLTDINNIAKDAKKTMDELTIELLKLRDVASSMLLKSELFMNFYRKHI